MKKSGVSLVILVCLLAGGGFYLSRVNDFQRDGELRLAALDRPVRVLRDSLGVPHIFAESTADLIRAQGFVTAQHRLFQLEAYRTILSGELAEAIGEKGLTSDIRMRVFGVRRNALRHAAALSGEARTYLGWFAEGLNAYVEGYPQDHHFEFSVAPFRVRTWTVEDLVAIVHYIHHRQAVNYKAELITQRLIDRIGADRASEIMPVNANPDRQREVRVAELTDEAATPLGLDWGDLLVGREDPATNGFGSNNWVVAPRKSASGHAIVANDPHLDSRILPGIWHPIGLFTPEIRAIGAALPGLPGILVGRTAHVAFGVTNSYGDVQDLYIETVDPEDPTRYLDGRRSMPFRTVAETIRIRDDEAPGGFRDHELAIRFTRRGPVLTEHGLGPGRDSVVVLRSTASELTSPMIGIERLLTAGSATEFERELARIDLLMFNFVFADDQGHIGQRATGAVPRRISGRGALPRRPPADGSDDWLGYIPKAEMPGGSDPARGWLGTANHDTRPDDYPYYYSSYFSPSYRYRRMGEVLNAAGKTTVEDHWRLIQDERNLQSDRLRSTIVHALDASGEQADLAAILTDWDGVDAVDSPAPLIYQTIYRCFALATFRDELGDELAADMLSAWYFWQERFDAMVTAGESRWFDNVTTTARIETMADTIRAAAREARSELNARFGEDPTDWRWGEAHTITFVSPLRQAGIGRDLLGGGEYEMSGSRDTLRRGSYSFVEPYAVRAHDSLRLVVDLGDTEKIAAVVPGGAVGRQFHAHQADQLEAWARGEMRHWWFSRDAIEANAVHEQRLVP